MCVYFYMHYGIMYYIYLLSPFSVAYIHMCLGLTKELDNLSMGSFLKKKNTDSLSVSNHRLFVVLQLGMGPCGHSSGTA